MIAYRISLALHLLSAIVWLGHMFFWSLFAGPSVKRVHPPEQAARLRTLSLRMGGLGWPALAVLAVTGVVILQYRLTLDPELLRGASGAFFACKLGGVGLMVLYQALVGHRPAPKLIYLNMAVALLVLGASVAFART